MRAMWLGEEGAAVKSLHLFGLVFPREKWVGIDDNPVAKQKLPGNPFFNVDGGKAEVLTAPKAVSAQPAPKRRGRPPKDGGAAVEDVSDADDRVTDSDFEDLE